MDRRTRKKIRRRLRRPLSPEGMAATLPHCRPLAWYRPGRRIHVADRMQTKYSYCLVCPPGVNFDSSFRPELTPAEMLSMGIFEGKYLNDCMLEFPREWFAEALRLKKLSPQGADPGCNEFGVKSRQSLAKWRQKGWIPVTEGDADVRGWFQWYCRYWIGRRQPVVDAIQVKRWRAFTRHRAQVVSSSKKKLDQTEKRKHRPKQRQALLQWAYNPYV